jgi:hypothetical protein
MESFIDTVVNCMNLLISCKLFLQISNLRKSYSITKVVKKNTKNLIDASKGVGLEVNTEKTKYVLLPSHQNAGQNYDINIGNRCFFKMWHSSNIWKQQ